MKTTNFFKKVIGFSIAPIVTYAMNILLVPILTQIFHPNQLGRLNYFNTIATIGMIIVLAGIDLAFIRFYHEPPEKLSKNQFLATSLYLGVLSFCICLFVFVIFEDNLYTAESYYNDIIFKVLLFINLFANQILRFVTNIYVFEKDIYRYSFLVILMLVVSKVIIVVTGSINGDYIFALLLSNLFLFVISVIWIRKVFIGYEIKLVNCFIRKTVAISLFKYGLPMVFMNLISSINIYIGGLLILNKMGFEDYGIYTIALALASCIKVATLGFTAYWSVYLFENHQDDIIAIQKINRYFVLTMLVFALLIVLFQDLIFLVIDARYVEARSYFAFLILSAFCFVVSDTIAVGIVISKKTYLDLISMLISVAVNILLCIVLIDGFGMGSVAIASGISGALFILIRTVIARKYYESLQNYSIVVLAVSTLFIVSTVCLMLDSQTFVRIGVIASLLIFCLIVYRKDIRRIIL